MKNVALLAISGALFLTGCASDDTGALKKDIEQLKKQKAKTEKEYQSLKEDNKKLDEEIKDKQAVLDQLKKEKEEEIKAQIKREEEEKKKQEAIAKRNKQIAQEKAAKEQKLRDAMAQKSDKLRKQQVMPNTIEASTHGKVKQIKSLKDVGLNYQENGMNISVNRIELFKVTDMPKDQVVLFNGQTEGYVMMYEVTAENTSNTPLYYNNIGVLNLGDRKVFSEFASFIPTELQENNMKQSKSHYNEYAPKEKTISYKSMAISKDDYQVLAGGKANFYIKGGVAQTKDMSNIANTQSDMLTIK
ncbi:DUF5068 domain-containing protein [Macrococcoides caseolyticum]|uniref:DUF5068 domain-containing protein n=1 Tax=Macrococcoides caseolyticum TaxID=69966 RepID=UPI001F1F72F3|nr:DUF5068 domain-containing protein [Macrococcus caseolyticus]MCE4955919.1 DUF5068 domain-containing protein [Macrococcus caseolyticus]